MNHNRDTIRRLCDEISNNYGDLTGLDPEALRQLEAACLRERARQNAVRVSGNRNTYYSQATGAWEKFQ